VQHFADFKQSVRDLDLWLSALVTHGFEDCNGLISIFRASLRLFVQYCVMTTVDFSSLIIMLSRMLQTSPKENFLRVASWRFSGSYAMYVADTQLINRKN